jgi:anti-sigma regulatory factor (Ser/Thr protein kinase)
VGVQLTDGDTQPFCHEAFFYRTRAEFLEHTANFIREGLDADEPTMAVLHADKMEALRSELGSHADRALFADMDQLGANPARIIPAWREFLDQHSGSGRRLRGIGEPIWAGRSPAELAECHRHESLLNLAFADANGFTLLCPYDTETLDAAVVEQARRTHPRVTDSAGSSHSHAYSGLDEVAAPFAEPLPEPGLESHVGARVFQIGTLNALRAFVAARADEAGFSRAAREELVLAANEVATNSVVHGGGGGVLRIWEADEALICEVNDSGRIENPLAGRERPEVGQTHGQGLWLANQLCDLVQLRTFQAGNAVRLHMRRR